MAEDGQLDHELRVLDRAAEESGTAHCPRSSRRSCCRARPGHPVSLVLVDPDHFKSINDRYRHLAGDAALRWVAAHPFFKRADEALCAAKAAGRASVKQPTAKDFSV